MCSHSWTGKVETVDCDMSAISTYYILPERIYCKSFFN